MTDWRMAIELVCGSNVYYGWLNPNSSTDLFGEYEYIDWRDKKKKPTKLELESAWNTYILENGTPEEQIEIKEQLKKEAINRLKLSADENINDLLLVLGVE